MIYIVRLHKTAQPIKYYIVYPFVHASSPFHSRHRSIILGVINLVSEYKSEELHREAAETRFWFIRFGRRVAGVAPWGF